MNLHPLSTTMSVSAQLIPDDIADIAAAGFRAVICNRPDGEGADQPNYAEIERLCTEHDIEAAYLPVVSGKVTDADALAFASLLDLLPKPILAYCRTGTRSTTLPGLLTA